MIRHHDKALTKRVAASAVRFTKLASEWFATEPGASVAASWTSDGILLVVARGKRAEDIAGVLEETGLARAQRREP